MRNMVKPKHPKAVLDCKHGNYAGYRTGMHVLFTALTALRQCIWSPLRHLIVLVWMGSLIISVANAQSPQAAILVYHRFGAIVADSMTTRTTVFEQQLDALQRAGYEIVPLDQVLAGLHGAAPMPDKALAITVDDGHRTVYSDLLPIIQRRHLPVTLFIYPSAISNASYALTWDQLRELAATPGVQVQSHTYWHPNFHTEKRRLPADEYARFVHNQLEKPRRVLKQQLGVDADVLAWPFGIEDAELQAAAQAAGYRAALALGNRHARADDSVWALPRYLMVDAIGVQGLLRELQVGARTTGVKP